MHQRFLPLATILILSSAAFGSTDTLTLAGVKTGETVTAMTTRLFAGVDHPLRYLSAFGPYKERTVKLGQYLIGFQAPVQIMGRSAISDMETVGIVGDGEPFLLADPMSQSRSDFSLIKAWYAAHEASTIVAASLSFPTTAYNDLALAAAAKYGKPDRTGAAVVSNAMGAKFDNHFVEWDDAHGNVLRLQERGEKLDVCVFSLSNTAGVAAQVRRIQAVLIKDSGL